MDLQLRDKLAIVTGSSKGIGHAIATGLAREGARVVINGRAQASVDAAISGIRAVVPDAALHPFAGDLAKAEVAEALIRAFPEPDILVNNLGIFEPVPFEQIPDEDWRRFFEVNVLSGVRLSRLVLASVTCRQLSTSSCSKRPAAPLLAWLPMRIARFSSSGASRSTSTKCQNSVLSGPRGRARRSPKIPFGKIEWLPSCTRCALRVPSRRSTSGIVALWYSWKSGIVSFVIPCT